MTSVPAEAPRFRDRTEAGQRLAAALAGTVQLPSVVAAIPRGGVEVALPVAETLGAPLTIAYARKLSAPVAPEVAFGALDEDGEVLTSPTTVVGLGLGDADVAEAKARVGAEIRRQMARYGVAPLARHLPGAAVVLVDDGLATGLTMLAAVAYARRHGACDVTVAIPCASQRGALRCRVEADRFVALVVDEAFVTTGAYYEDFSPVTDERVLELLGGALAAAPGGEARVLRFRNARGLALVGDLLLAPGPGPVPAVVFAHGQGSGRKSPCDRPIAEALQAAGLAVLLFDFTGHGDSEGSAEESTVARQVEDLGAAIDALVATGQVDPLRIGLAGASSGALAALRRAAMDGRIRALVLRSPNPEGAEDAAVHVRAPVLLLAGDLDRAAHRAAVAIQMRLTGPARLEVIEGAGHLFEVEAARTRAAELTRDWFARHLAVLPRARAPRASA